MRKNNPFLIAFIDIGFNFLLIFVVLFVLFVHPKAKKEEQIGIRLEDEYLIYVEWDKERGDDIDTYVLDPQYHLVFFRRLQDGFMHLDRDDRGIANDTIIAPDGTSIVIKKNEEYVFLRGIIPGEYIVNVHWYYNQRENTPVKVKIKLVRLKKINKVLFEKEVTLEYVGDEKTAFRFTLDQEGNLTSTNDIFRSLVTIKDLYPPTGGH